MKKVAILGAGSWGTALARVLSDNGHQVMLWGNNAEVLQEINEKHTNEKYLPGSKLPDAIRGEVILSVAIDHADMIVFAVPTVAIRSVAKQVSEILSKKTLFVHVSKGIEPSTLKRISEMLFEELPEKFLQNIVVLSGPSHAEEVIKGMPTTITAACTDLKDAQLVQELFSNRVFRVYTNDDVVGVELGGALKNIIALAGGLTDGLKYGDNAKAALMTRGLAEITRLGVKLGANPLTFAGLSGLGDLIVTCTSVHSRNWRAGNMLGQGKNLDEILENMGMVVEGVRTTQAAYELSQKLQVDMPITHSLYEILFENKQPKDVVEALMNRDLTKEIRYNF